MLRIENLVFDAWGRRFFDSASVAIPAGTKVGLVGRNGVGKSTLFKLIVGDLVPLGGEILLPKARADRLGRSGASGDAGQPARHDPCRRHAARSAQCRAGDRRAGGAGGNLPRAQRHRCGSRAGARGGNPQRSRLCQCRSRSRRWRSFPAAGACAWRSRPRCSPSRTCCCSTSRPTISISKARCGSKRG